LQAIVMADASWKERKAIALFAQPWHLIGPSLALPHRPKPMVA
jgi:hypothetical protein